jgi:probable HAF family extracellular repeat protein
MKLFSPVVPLFVLSAAVASAAAADPQYRDVSIAPVVGDALPVAMNELGVVVMRKTVDGQTNSFLFDSKRGVITRTFDGEAVNSVSANGNVVGASADGAFFDGGQGNVPVPLQNARAVNNDGVVAGFVGGFAVQPAIYSTADGVLTLLAPTGVNGSALAINSSSQATGSARIGPDNTSHAFRWTEGSLLDLGALDGVGTSVGLAIDEGGRVVGSSSAGSERHAFLYDGSLGDLGTLPGCDRSEATAISNSGMAGGDSDLCADSPNARAFVRADGALFDLNQLAPAADGAVYSSVAGISASGTIVGIAVAPDGTARAYLLVPVRGR